MNIHALWIIAIAFVLVACGKQEPPAAQQAEPEAPAQVTPEWDEEFVDHMHAHAEHLDDLMFALADGDLMKAKTPAYWLSRHRSVTGVPEEWQQYIEGMRDGAFAVGGAPDIESAMRAAEKISAQCQGCHTAAGVTVDSGATDDSDVAVEE